MYRIRFLILLCSLLSLALGGCGYSFVLQGAGNLRQLNLMPSANKTSLQVANLTLDAHLETDLGVMGIATHATGQPKLTCTIMSATSEEITSSSQGNNRYRLTVFVQAVLTDTSGKTLWQNMFSDDGYYATSGQEENALDEAFGKITSRIAQNLVAIKI